MAAADPAATVAVLQMVVQVVPLEAASLTAECVDDDAVESADMVTPNEPPTPIGVQALPKLLQAGAVSLHVMMMGVR